MSLVAYLGIASGVALVLTGIGLGAARPQRAGGWFFVAFLLAWGTEIGLFNSLGLIESAATDRVVLQTALAVVVVEILFLVHFTVRFARLMDTRHRWWSWGAAAYAVLVGGAMAVNPDFFAGIGGTTLAGVALILVPNFAAFYVTVGILADRHDDSRSEIEHREVRVILLGLLLYASYTAGFYLSLYGGLLLTGPTNAVWVVFAGLFAAATAFLIGLAYQRWRTHPPPEHWSSWEKPVILGSILVPMVVGLATGTAQLLDLPRIDLFGLPRIAAALLIAYGLLKFEIFDIDQKAKAAIRRTAIGAVFVLVFFAISESVEVFVGEEMGRWAGLGAAGVLTLAFRPIEEGAARLADRIMPGVDDSAAYEEKRKSEVYQAAVERAVGDEVLTEREKEILTGLREELGLREEEAHEIERRVLPQPMAV